MQTSTTLIPSQLQTETKNQKEQTAFEKLSKDNAVLKQKVQTQEKVIYNLQRQINRRDMKVNSLTKLKHKMIEEKKSTLKQQVNSTPSSTRRDAIPIEII